MIRLAHAAVAALLIAATVVTLSVICARSADAQGIYMGRDGRAHAQIIVGPDGGIFPVIPSPCYGGPCPVLLAPPLPWRHPQFGPPSPPPLGYAPEPTPPPPPAPLGWIWRYYAPCGDPDCRTLVINVSVDGLNVRTVPQGPVVGALANGTPVIPLQKDGDWVLVAPACALSQTFTWSVTTGIPLSVCS
jgi:hypothetical protein